MRYRWFIKEEERFDEFGAPVSRAEQDKVLHPKKPGYSRGELMAIVATLVILCYEWADDDVQLIFVCMSFLVYELQPLVLMTCRNHGREICNVLRGFSIATFIGALVWTLL